MKNMGNMMKQAQKLQNQMVRMQEELASKTVDATAGGGMVSVTVNCAQPPQVLAVTIDKEVVDPEDVEMLQDLVMAAINEAIKQAQQVIGAEMGKLTGGLNIPGLM